jgi:hypothetical protein
MPHDMHHTMCIISQQSTQTVQSYIPEKCDKMYVLLGMNISHVRKDEQMHMRNHIYEHDNYHTSIGFTEPLLKSRDCTAI